MGRAALDEWVGRLPVLTELAESGATAVIGCSGGADSLALLALAAAAGVPAVAVHVDHGLRDGSEADYSVVARAAVDLGVRSTGRRIVVEPGPNLEARARDA